MATDTSTAMLDTINSLDMNEVPNKLKCAICSKLALNAFKLPCCAQSICESCQSILQGSCPVCEHDPLSLELCVPHKALRNTIKAYLKTAEKKLAEEKAKAQRVPILSAAPNLSIATPENVQDETPEVKQEPVAPDVPRNGTPAPVADETFASHDIGPDDPQLSIEEPVDQQMSSATNVPGDADNEDATAQNSDLGTQQPEDFAAFEQPMRNGAHLQEVNKPFGSMPPNGTGMGMNMMQNMMSMNMGGAGNRDYNQLMQFMSNPMMNGMGDMNNMMGMPGMGMDPMSQGMFGAMAGPGMGMNQMNGMNMGFDLAGGQGLLGGWNNQGNMWSGQQNNNPNAFANGMDTNFGSNSGFGYNMNQQGNFQQNQYPYNDFQHGYRGQGYPRGRGRGRAANGWRGRGGYGYNMQGDQSSYQNLNHQQHQQQYNQPVNGISNGDHTNDQIEQASATGNDQVMQSEDDFAPGGQEDTNEALGIKPTETLTAIEDQEAESNQEVAMPEAIDSSKSPDRGQESHETEDVPAFVQPIPVLTTEPDTPTADVQKDDMTELQAPRQNQNSMPPPTAPLGPAAQFGHGNVGFRGRGFGRYAPRGRGAVPLINGHSFNPPTEPKGHGVIGAPTGPKALRKDATPTGPRGAGEGLQIMGRATTVAHLAQRSQISKPTYEEATKDHDGYVDQKSRTQSQSRSRSASRHRSSRHKPHHESRDRTGAENDTRSQKDRKHRNGNDEMEFEVSHEQHGYSRSPSVASSRNDSHRHRDKDRSLKEKHRSSHRSHRHRDDSRLQEHIGEEPVPESRSSSHRRHRDRERSSKYESSHREERHRDRKRSRRDDEEVKPETIEDESRHQSRHKKYKHADETRSDSRPRQKVQPTEPEKDPHTLEREARNRERMLKEQQRREAVEADRNGKGRRDSRQDRGHGARRVSYKYEDEASTSRVEHERESARWI